MPQGDFDPTRTIAELQEELAGAQRLVQSERARAEHAILEQQKLCDKHQKDANKRAQKAEAQAHKDREKCAVLERENVALRREIGDLRYKLNHGS